MGKKVVLRIDIKDLSRIFQHNGNTKCSIVVIFLSIIWLMFTDFIREKDGVFDDKKK